MSSTTPNLGLTKTTAAETIGQNWAASNDSGGNFDIIDAKMGAVGDTSLQAQVTALNSKLTTITQDSITYTDSNGHSVNLYFRVWNNVLSVLMNSDYAIILPTTWTAIGSLANIRPQSDRYIPFLCPGGGSGVIRIYADGGVRIYGNQSTAVWLQTSGSVVFK